MKEELQDTNSTIYFEDEEGTRIPFEVIAQTTSEGREFLLVQDPEEGLAYIMEACASVDDTVTYRVVEDDDEIRELGELFAEILEDVDFEYES
ncbi:MAG: DUF1292 domain-containing protein [Lachnospiraceae bacterium]|nr:DUF1292 domain-containing protein [Lachnospiraceae bacterium]